MGRAAIIYNRPRWSTGQRAAAVGALLVAVIMPMWLASLGAHSSSIEPSSSIVKAPITRAPMAEPVAPVMQPAPLPIAAAAPPVKAVAGAQEASDAPYRYSGHWRQGARTTALVLTGPGYSTVVRVPGPVDDRFDVVSIDDKRVLLKDRQAQKFLALPLSGESAQPAVDPLKVMPQTTRETTVTPSPVPKPPTVAPVPAPTEVPVMQFGGSRADVEPEN